MSRKITLRAWLERLQSQGRYSFTGSEARVETGLLSRAFQSALERLVAKGRVASPRQGFHVIVPPEYRSLGCLPASWFIDDMMGHMDTPYYVGLLSAAALHGAAHQRPMELQVAVDRPLRPVSWGRVRVHFIESSRLPDIPTVRMRTETGYMKVSTPEATAFDLVHYYHHAGSLSNAATVLGELAETGPAPQWLDLLTGLGPLGFFISAENGILSMKNTLADLNWGRISCFMVAKGRSPAHRERLPPWVAKPSWPGSTATRIRLSSRWSS